MAGLPIIVQQRKAVRVFVVVYPASRTFFEHPYSCIDTMISHLNADPNDSNPLVIQKWPNRTLIVFDLCHITYDNQSAHNIETIPVITVHVRSNTHFKTKQADRTVAQEINSQVAECHNLHGFSQTLPFEEDHRNGIVPDYPNPRRLIEQ